MESPIKNSSEFDINLFVRPYLLKWYWFLGSLLFFIFSAFVYMHYSNSVYNTRSAVISKDAEKSLGGNGVADVGILECLAVFCGMNTSSINNGLEIFKIPQNPLLIDVTKQINSLKRSLLEYLQKNKTTLQFALDEYQSKEDDIGSIISRIPFKEKLFRIILGRQQHIKENLYLLLLQKKERKVISLSSFAANASMVEPSSIVEEITLLNQVNPKCDIIYSDMMPPNPTELLKNERLGVLVEILKKNYDYIIIDTALVLFITDTLTIAKYSYLELSVTRSNYTDNELVEFANVVESGKQHNIAFVLNDLKQENSGYGNKYC